MRIFNHIFFEKTVVLVNDRFFVNPNVVLFCKL